MVFISRAGWYIRVLGNYICCNYRVTNKSKVYKVLFSKRFVNFSSHKTKMEKKYSRGKCSKLLIYVTISAIMAVTSFFSAGCSPKNIRINPIKSEQTIPLERSKVHHYIDEIKKEWLIVNPYEKVSKKGRNLYDIVEVIPPEGSRRIQTKKELEEVVRNTHYKTHEIVTTASPESKEKSIAGHIYEGKDPNPFDDKYSWSEAERSSEKIKGRLPRKIKGRLPEKIKIKIKYNEEREGGDGNSGNGGNDSGVGGTGGNGNSAGG